jgi:vacuolar-type H+-ATPase subunit E/Vma4
MLKRFFLKIAINNVIKQMPKFKEQAKEIVEKNIDGFLDRVEQSIEALLLGIIAKKENK